MKSTVFNPFKANIHELLISTFEKRMKFPFPPSDIEHGCGVYAIYYSGNHPAYKKFLGSGETPIYVGKAVIPGGRKGSGNSDKVAGNYITGRLRQHAASISKTNNLNLADFKCRWLLVVPAFANTAEAILIDHYKPLWNSIITGFGIHAPGKGRQKQARSHWDMLHPGRVFANNLPIGRDEKELIKNIELYFKNIKGS